MSTATITPNEIIELQRDARNGDALARDLLWEHEADITAEQIRLVRAEAFGQLDAVSTKGPLFTSGPIEVWRLVRDVVTDEQIKGVLDPEMTGDEVLVAVIRFVRERL